MTIHHRQNPVKQRLTFLLKGGAVLFLSLSLYPTFSFAQSPCEDFLVLPGSADLNKQIKLPFEAENQCDSSWCHMFTAKTFIENQIANRTGKVRLSTGFFIVQHAMIRTFQTIIDKDLGNNLRLTGNFHYDIALIAKVGAIPAKSWQPKVNILKEPNYSIFHDLLQAKINEFKPRIEATRSLSEKNEIANEAARAILETTEKFVGEIPAQIRSDGKILTPVEFFKKAMSKDPKQMTLVYNRALTGGSVAPFQYRYGTGFKDFILIQRKIVPSNEMARFIVESIDAGKPVPLSFYSVRSYIDHEAGTYTLPNTKRIKKHDDNDLHEVLVTGYEIAPLTGKVTMTVRNSWGIENGNNGDYTLAADYFLNYVYEIIL